MLEPTEFDRAYDVYCELWESIHKHVDERLETESEAVSENVRQRLTEEFRFWKRRQHGQTLPKT